MPTTYEHTPPIQERAQSQATVVNRAYAFVPKGASNDAAARPLTGWTKSRAWIIAAPSKGFPDRFSQYSVEVHPGGGSRSPEPEPGVEAVVFLTGGTLQLTLDGEAHALEEGSYAYLAAGADWTMHNASAKTAHFQWIRKAYIALDGHRAASFVTTEREAEATPNLGTNGSRSTTQFVAADDLAHDMHVNIVTLQPNGSAALTETHAMEHGIFVLSGSALYRLNEDWVRVQAGDSLLLRAFCPQACHVTGPEEFRYLQYKEVNRQCRLT